ARFVRLRSRAAVCPSGSPWVAVAGRQRAHHRATSRPRRDRDAHRRAPELPPPAARHRPRDAGMGVAAVTRIQPECIRRALEALLIEHPELAADAELRADVIEGETEAFEVLGIVLADLREAQAMQSAISERIADLRTRIARFERREDFARKLLMRIMDAAR